MQVKERGIVLIPIDFSEQSIFAIKQSYNLAKYTHSKIVLLHVYEKVGEERYEDLTKLTKQTETESGGIPVEFMNVKGDEGMQPREAAIAGVQEINIAVIGCTATLLLAFLPIMALPEGAGAFVRSLPVAVVTTIIASLFVALTIIPFLASRLLPRSDSGHSNALLDSVMAAIHNIYRPALHVAVAHPRKTVIIGLAAFVLSLGLIPRLGFSLFPENDSPYFLVDIERRKAAPSAKPTPR